MCECGSDRVAEVTAKCSDLFHLYYKDVEYNGYVKYGIGLGGGDYIEFEYCLECGRIQGKFPIGELNEKT